MYRVGNLRDGRLRDFTHHHDLIPVIHIGVEVGWSNHGMPTFGLSPLTKGSMNKDTEESPSENIT